MEPSILYTIKKMLGVTQEEGPFDEEIEVGINSALMTLDQIGIGPPGGLVVTGVTQTWSDLLDDYKDLEAVKSYIYMKTRLIFDPPTNSFLVNALEEQMKEYEWRLSIRKDERRLRDDSRSIHRPPRHKGHEMGRPKDPGATRT